MYEQTPVLQNGEQMVVKAFESVTLIKKRVIDDQEKPTIFKYEIHACQSLSHFLCHILHTYRPVGVSCREHICTLSSLKANINLKHTSTKSMDKILRIHEMQTWAEYCFQQHFQTLKYDILCSIFTRKVSARGEIKLESLLRREGQHLILPQKQDQILAQVIEGIGNFTFYNTGTCAFISRLFSRVLHRLKKLPVLLLGDCSEVKQQFMASLLQKSHKCEYDGLDFECLSSKDLYSLEARQLAEFVLKLQSNPALTGYAYNTTIPEYNTLESVKHVRRLNSPYQRKNKHISTEINASKSLVCEEEKESTCKIRESCQSSSFDEYYNHSTNLIAVGFQKDSNIIEIESQIINDEPATLLGDNEVVLDVKNKVQQLKHDLAAHDGSPSAPVDNGMFQKELGPHVLTHSTLDERCATEPVGLNPKEHWTLNGFRPRDSVRPRPTYSPQVHTEPFPLDNLRQRMQQRAFRIASMVHLGSSLPLGVVRLADADLYYDEDKDEMCCCNCSWGMPRTQFQKTKDPVECHSCRGRTRGDCGAGSMGIAVPAESVAHEDSLPLAESRDNAVPPCVEVDDCVKCTAPDSLLHANDTMTDCCFSSSESIAQFPRERCTAGCSGSFHQLGSETSSATIDALLSTGETASLVQQSSSNSVSCTNDQSSAEGIGFETDHTSSSEDMGSGQSPCLHTAEFRTEALTDAADQSLSEDEATRHDSETESTYHENHSPTESCGDEMHEDETDLKS